MPTWGETLKEVQESARVRGLQGPDLDGIRLKYIRALRAHSGRAVISYATAWLNKHDNNVAYSLESQDIHGLMEVCHGIEERELDLILHSPGGSAQAAEQAIEYLRTRFDYIRAIIPLQAKSAATMMALGCDEIVMGDHSELGPIDPQILIPVPEGTRYAPAHAILRDFARAKEECKQDISSLAAWTPILKSYAGGLIEFCHQQVKLSIEVVTKWLARYMLCHDDMEIPEGERAAKADSIATWFGSEEAYDRFRTHGRPIRFGDLKSIGMRVRRLENDPILQDAALSILHATQITFNGPSAKVIENHLGNRFVLLTQTIAMQARPLEGQQPPSGQQPHLSRQKRRALERKRR